MIPKVNSIRIIFFLFVTFVEVNAFASNVTNFIDTTRFQQIGKEAFIYEDSTGLLKYEDIIQLDSKFEASKGDVLNLGVSESAFWIKFVVKNGTNKDKMYLEIPYPILDEVSLFEKSGESYKVFKQGEVFPFSQRLFQHPSYIFELDIPSKQSKTVYLRVKGKEQLQVPLTLGTFDVLLKSIRVKDILFALYCGIIISMFFYNLFLYVSVKDKIYLLYVLYILCVGVTQITLQGYSFQYLWPSYPSFAMFSDFLFPTLVAIFLVAFMKVFLQTKSLTPGLNIGLNGVVAAYVLSTLLAFAGLYSLSYKLIQISGMFTAIYMLFVGFAILGKGFKPAKFFLLGWFVFLLGVVLFAIKDFGILPLNNFTNYTMQAGSAMEVILLSFALADRIKILQKEKQVSQAQALEALEENKRIITLQNIVLQQKVKDRTSELTKSNEELAIAIKDLKEAQSQLVQSEKMASLGQLTAGVAHEINNPINFVSSSIKPLRRDINDILAVLKEYDSLSKENFETKINEITSLKSDLDIDYVKHEIDSLLKGIDEGASRTSEIVKGLRTFSRVDETDLKRIDIHEGIDSTLILLTSMMRGRIVVEKQYSNLSPIECYAGKMNQVLMNILNNAIHAIFKKDLKEGEGKITIRTFEEGQNVVIGIKDNGTGIPEDVKQKIFDPFFTTKDVGEGTGLGLSIVYNIIENHKGKIEVNSKLGEGTEFLITLPKRYPGS